MLFAEGKPDEAEYRYQSVSSQIGGDASSLMALAEAYMDLGRFIDAASAVRRARNLQPWNLRVQALGKNLEKLAEEVERARAEAMQQAFPPDPSTYSEPWQREESYMLQQRQGGGQEYYEEIRHAPDPRMRRPQAPVQNNQARRSDGYDVRPAGGDPRQRPEVQRRAPQATYIPVDGRMVSVRPGEAVRAGADGQVRAESGNRVREIQAAATPSSPSGRSLRPYPATEVDLSRANGAEVRPAPAPGITNHTGLTPLDLGYTPGNRDVVGDGEGKGGASARPAESGSLRPGPAAAGAAPAPETARGEGGAPEAYGDDSELVRYDSSHRDRYDGIREEQGYDASRRRADQRYESRYDSDDYGRRDDARSEGRRPELYNPFQDPFADSPADRRSLRPAEDARQGLRPDVGQAPDNFDDRHDFGQVPGVEGAYASLRSWEVEDMNSGAGSVPKAFNFDPDFSPVIIADMRSPSRSGGDMPVRNPNLYRRRSGDRQPAEIIEKDPVAPREARDEAGMAPADDGKVRRAEVKLPSSSQGVGMTSDYSWDR